MSAKIDKKKSAKSPSTSNVTVGASGRRSLHLKLWGLGVLAVVVLAGVIIGVYAITSSGRNQPADPQGPKLTPLEQSQVYASNGKYDAAEQVLTSQLASAHSPASKIDIYSQQATIALNFKKYPQAKHYAQQAEKVKPSASTAYSLGYVAQLAKDNSTAAKYFKLAISRLDKNAPGYNLILQDYKSQLSEVKG